MGHVDHTVTYKGKKGKEAGQSLLSIGIASIFAAAFLSGCMLLQAGMLAIADGIRHAKTTYEFNIQNEGRKPVVKAYKVENGELVPVK